jgi:transposase
MGTSNYSDAFKRDAVQQIRVRGSPVREVSQPLGLSSHSLYKWMKPFAEPGLKRPGADHEAENRRLQRERARVTEEREILEKGEPLCATGSRTMAKVHIARESQ